MLNNNEIPLCKAIINNKYIICNIKYTTNNTTNRLSELGFVKGEIVVPVYKSAFGNTTAYLIKSAVFGIREEQACDIIVRPVA